MNIISKFRDNLEIFRIGNLFVSEFSGENSHFPNTSLLENIVFPFNFLHKQLRNCQFLSRKERNCQHADPNQVLGWSGAKARYGSPRVGKFFGAEIFLDSSERRQKPNKKLRLSQEFIAYEHRTCISSCMKNGFADLTQLVQVQGGITPHRTFRPDSHVLLNQMV